MVKYGFAQSRVRVGSPPVTGGWRQVGSKKPDRSFVRAGVEYHLQGKWVRHLPIKSGERILGIVLGILCSTFSLGLAPVFSKRVVRWITGRQVLRVFQKAQHKPELLQPLPVAPIYVPRKPQPRPTPIISQTPALALPAPIVTSLPEPAPTFAQAPAPIVISLPKSASSTTQAQPLLALPAPIVTSLPEPAPTFAQATTPIVISLPKSASSTTQAQPLLALPAPIATSFPEPTPAFAQAPAPIVISLPTPASSATQAQPLLALPAPIVTSLPEPAPAFAQAPAPIIISLPKPASSTTQARPLLALPAPIATSFPQPTAIFTPVPTSLCLPVPPVMSIPRPLKRAHPLLALPVPQVNLVQKSTAKSKSYEEEVTEFIQHCGAVVDALFVENNAQDLVQKEIAFIRENQEKFQRVIAVEEHWKTYRSVIALVMGSISQGEREDFARAVGECMGKSFLNYPRTKNELSAALEDVDALPWQLALAIEWRLMEEIDPELFNDLPIEKLTPFLEHFALHQEETLELSDANGNTMLHHAIRQGKTPLACLLIRLGVSLTDMNDEQLSPLHHLKDLPAESRLVIVQEIVKREMIEKQDRVKESAAGYGAAAGLSKKIRLGKHLNTIGLWNKKWIRKPLGGKKIPEKWAKVGTIFDFTARVYKLYEVESHFEEIKARLNLEISQVEAMANNTEDPLERVEQLKKMRERQADLKKLQDELDESKRKGMLDVAEAAAPFGAQILRFIPRAADGVAKWVPGISALTCGFSVYKGWGAIQEMDDKLKAMQMSFEQLKVERDRIELLRAMIVPESLVDRILALKMSEIVTKMQFLERQIGQADVRKQVEEWANWANGFQIVSMAAAYAFPPAGIAVAAVGAVGFTPFAVDAYQYWENYGQMNENDFAPLVVADYEQRLSAIAMRFGKSTEQLKSDLDALVDGLQSQELEWLKAILQYPVNEVEASETEMRAGILNYILN